MSSAADQTYAVMCVCFLLLILVIIRVDAPQKMTKHVNQVDDSFQERLLAFCGPIYIAPSPDAAPCEILDNGTFGLVDTGQKKLLVTCWHVWDYFENERLNNPDVVMAVVLGTGYKTHLFTPILIDADRDIDLAVFEWTGDTLEEKSFFPVWQFPITRVDKGSMIIFQGFPRMQSQGTQTQGRFGALYFGGIVTAVSERQIVVMNPGSRSLVSVETGDSLQHFEISGVSGSPAYTFRDGWNLAGFVCAGKTTEGSLFLTHASFIKPDGMLDRSQLKER